MTRTLPCDVPAWTREQRALAARVVLRDDFDGPRVIGGFDVAYDEDTGFGALVLLDAGTLDTLEAHHVALPIDVPYVPAYLRYRELPLAEALWDAVERKPDVLFVDGAGIMHPRRVGSATHIGVTLDVPTVGVTKRRSHGRLERALTAPGDAAPVRARDDALLGYAYWSSPRAMRPIWVSTGHRVSHETALALVKPLCRTKLPEPVQRADAEAAVAKRAARGEGTTRREDQESGQRFSHPLHERRRQPRRLR